MAANMQYMAGAGQMVPQQLRKPSSNQLQQIVYQNLVQHTQPFTGICWQANVAIGDRLFTYPSSCSTLASGFNVDLLLTGSLRCGNGE
ncbi:hypothetical protein AUP68_12404 [Ilyonectria robusta]